MAKMMKTFTKADIEKARAQRVSDRLEREERQNAERLAAFESFMDRSYLIGADWRAPENTARVVDLKEAFTAGWWANINRGV